MTTIICDCCNQKVPFGQQVELLITARRKQPEPLPLVTWVSDICPNCTSNLQTDPKSVLTSVINNIKNR